MRHPQSQKGFTLIEAVLYIGLLALVMTSVLIATYRLIETTDKTQARAMVQGDAQFVLAKIDEAMNGATGVILDPDPTHPNTIIVTNPNLADPAESPITISYDAANKFIRFKRQNNPDFENLNGTIAPIVPPVAGSIFSVSGTAPNKILTTNFKVESPLYKDSFTSTRVIR
jgi:type II secretory pathway pseudopilin PulG